MTINELNNLANMVAFNECGSVNCEICPLYCGNRCVSVSVLNRIDELRKPNIDKIEVFLRGKADDTIRI